MKKFTLINPVIVGKMDTKFKAENSLDAASKMWNELSSHISGNVPRTYITLKDESDDLHHFKVEEKIGRSKTADYTISEFKLDLSDEKKKQIIKEAKKYQKKGNNIVEKQSGGSIEHKPKRDRSKDSSSSSSSFDSDDDDYYNFRRYRARRQAPLNLLYYTPTIYGVDTIFFPTFNTVVSPYVTLYVPIF